MSYSPSLAFARRMDAGDPLRPFRNRFHIPRRGGKNVIYFCGNSLGLQPKSVRAHLDRELHNWATNGVEGHFEGAFPWKYYHHFFKEKMARIVGARPLEITIMNGLTANLHLMMVSFYKPEGKRRKIIMETGAFPSDQYAVETQIGFHGLDYSKDVIEISPRKGEYHLRTEDILSTIQQNKDELALIMFGGVNYYTGQYFDIPAITKAGREAGAYVGFDLAHAAGNVPLSLHDWGVDFAVWCNYKYLNGGPGATAGAFVHERHANNPKGMKRFAGWWGHDEATRFLMRKGFSPMPGADGWQLSNAPVFSMAPLLASLEIFDEAGMGKIRAKSESLTGYAYFLLNELRKEGKQIFMITPEDPRSRGSQISILTGGEGKIIFDYLTRNGVILDWREPNVIRFAPAPLYNSFEDVFRFYKLLKDFKL